MEFDFICELKEIVKKQISLIENDTKSTIYIDFANRCNCMADYVVGQNKESRFAFLKLLLTDNDTHRYMHAAYGMPDISELLMPLCIALWHDTDGIQSLLKLHFVNCSSLQEPSRCIEEPLKAGETMFAVRGEDSTSHQGVIDGPLFGISFLPTILWTYLSNRLDNLSNNNHCLITRSAYGMHGDNCKRQRNRKQFLALAEGFLLHIADFATAAAPTSLITSVDLHLLSKNERSKLPVGANLSGSDNSNKKTIKKLKLLQKQSRNSKGIKAQGGEDCRHMVEIAEREMELARDPQQTEFVLLTRHCNSSIVNASENNVPLYHMTHMIMQCIKTFQAFGTLCWKLNPLSAQVFLCFCKNALGLEYRNLEASDFIKTSPTNTPPANSRGAIVGDTPDINECHRKIINSVLFGRSPKENKLRLPVDDQLLMEAARTCIMIQQCIKSLKSSAIESLDTILKRAEYEMLPHSVYNIASLKSFFCDEVT